jgi:DUF917 family protein
VHDIDIETHRPHITTTNEWIINELDLGKLDSLYMSVRLPSTTIEWIAEGCAVLGCGGGGAPYPAFLMVRQILREGGRVRIVDESYFDDGNALVIPVGFMGSPSVSNERIPSGTEIPTASAALIKFCGGEKVAAILSYVPFLFAAWWRKDCDDVFYRTEIGGKNGVEPMRLSSSHHLDCPLLDGKG